MNIKWTLFVDTEHQPGVTEVVTLPIEPGMLDNEAIEQLRQHLDQRNGQWANATPEEVWSIVEEVERVA